MVESDIIGQIWTNLDIFGQTWTEHDESRRTPTITTIPLQTCCFYLGLLIFVTYATHVTVYMMPAVHGIGH